MKCFGFIPVYMSSIIIAIFNIVFGFSDLIYMIHAYSKLDNWTTLENVFIFLSLTYNVLQIFFIYGLVRKKAKIILLWILLEAIMLVAGKFTVKFIYLSAGAAEGAQLRTQYLARCRFHKLSGEKEILKIGQDLADL